MSYSDFEIKLIRHALDTNSEGEAANAATMFFRELRKRGIKAYHFLDDNVTKSNPLTDIDLHRELLYLRTFTHQQGTELAVERGARLRAEQALAIAKQELATRHVGKNQVPWWKGKAVLGGLW